MQSIEVPRELAEYVKPLYMCSLDRVLAMNPAKLLEKKLEVGDRLKMMYQELRKGLIGGGGK